MQNDDSLFATPLDRIRWLLSRGGPGAALYSLDAAIGAALQAGFQTIAANRNRPPREQLAVAIEAAVGMLQGIAAAVAEMPEPGPPE
jgi:hypothetical protein